MGHVADMEGGFVVRKPAEKGSHGRSWRRWAVLNQTLIEGRAWTRLTFNRQTGQCCPLKGTPFVPKRVKNVLQWALKLNSALVSRSHLAFKGHMWRYPKFPRI